MRLQSPRWTLAHDPDLTSVLAHTFQRNFHISLAQQSRKFLSPLNQQNAVSCTQIIEGQGVEFPQRVDAVKINVVKMGSGSVIFVDQREGRTGDVFFGGRLERRGDSLYQRGLP